jgi:hypothetical protein
MRVAHKAGAPYDYMTPRSTRDGYFAAQLILRYYCKNNYKFRVGMYQSHGVQYGYLLSLISQSRHHYTQYAYQPFLAHALDKLLRSAKKDQANLSQENVSTYPLGVCYPPTSAVLYHRPIRERQKSLSIASTL